jgi:hypothetical protein
VSILDLQTLGGDPAAKKGSPGSRASQACNGNNVNASTLSLLCDFP